MDQENQDRIFERLDKVESQILALYQRVERLESAPAPAPVPSPAPPLAPCAVAPPPLPVALPVMTVIPATRPKVELCEPEAGQPDEPARDWLGPVSPAFDWRELLRKFNMLPPSGEGGNMETQVGTWWAPRIGTVLLVAMVVFFAVYMAQFSRPWVRFIELAAISLGMTGLGLWLERRYPKMGAVVFGGGLAMDYFCAFAAQAIPAVRIISDPATGALLQYAAAGAIVGASLWRDSSVIATMAVACGYVACFFSFSAGLSDAALVAALLLGGGATYLFLKRSWRDPYLVALPLTYLLYAVVLTLGWNMHRATAPSFWMAHLYLIAYLALYAGADLAALAHGGALEPRLRPLQLVSSSAAALLGYLATRNLFPVRLPEFYFLYGAIFTGFSITYYLLRHPDAIMNGYFLKGSALVTMGLITSLGGRTRWAALGVESFVLLFSAQRTRLKATELMMGAIWLVSAWFFLVSCGSGFAPSAVMTAVALGYVLGSALLLGLHDRWLGRPQAAVDHTYGLIRGTYIILSVMALGVCTFAAGAAHWGDNMPLGTALLAIAVGAVGLALGSIIPLAAATIPFVGAHLYFWIKTLDNGWGGNECWFNGQGLVLVTLALAAGAGWLGRWRESRPAGKAGATLRAEGVLHVLWSVTLFILFHKTFEPGTVLGLMVAVALGATALAFILPTRLLADFAPMTLALVLLFGLHRAPLPVSVASELALWLALLGAWAYACGTSCLGGVREQLRLLRCEPAPNGEPFQWIHGAMAFMVGVYTLGHATLLHGGAEAGHLVWAVVDPASMTAFALAGVAAAALTRWPGYKPGYCFGLGYLALAQLFFYGMSVGRLAGAWSFIGGAVLVAALTVGVGLAAGWLWPELTRTTRRGIQWGTAGAALVLCLVLFQRQPGELSHYTTALWGTSAIAIFLAGLAGRAKPMRLVGLAGLALCIPRVFIVDIHSALYRIAASGVLGVVVLLVAFLYNRYRGVIEARDEAGA